MKMYVILLFLMWGFVNMHAQATLDSTFTPNTNEIHMINDLSKVVWTNEPSHVVISSKEEEPNSLHDLIMQLKQELLRYEGCQCEIYADLKRKIQKLELLLNEQNTR